MMYLAWSVFLTGVLAAVVGLFRTERWWYGVSLVCGWVTIYFTIQDVRSIWGILGNMASFLDKIRGMLI